MAVRVNNQKELRARSKLSFCYLCGEAFDDVPSNMGEHVISRGVLGQASDRTFPVKLPAHQECDDTLKMPYDGTMAMWHRVMAEGLGSVSASDQRAFANSCEEIVHPDGRQAFVFRRIGELRQAGWNWVRGMHSVLYHAYLPPETKRVVLAPVPSYWLPNESHANSAPNIQAALEDSEHMSAWILQTLHQCFTENQFDGISFWDHKATYVCVWVSLPYKEALCIWALATDRVSGLIRNPDWPAAPWHGWYTSTRVPENASTISVAVVD